MGGTGFVRSHPERRPGKPRVIRTDIAVLFAGDEDETQALLLGEGDYTGVTRRVSVAPRWPDARGHGASGDGSLLVGGER